MSGLDELDRGTTPAAPRPSEPSEEPAAAGTAPVSAPATPPKAPAAAPTLTRKVPGARRTGADPVKALMHRHRELCESAVDPLEIAAGLEAHGVTDRTAARFRHRDVFSLAEEMYARVPRGIDSAEAGTTVPETARIRADWLLRALLPGALAVAAVTGVQLTQGRTRLFAAVAGVLAVALGVRAALTRGPLSSARRAPHATHPAASRGWTWWLLGYAALGDALLRAAVDGGPDRLPDGTTGGPWPLAVVPALALTLSCVPAALTAHLLTEGARRRLSGSRGLTEFAAAVRPPAVERVRPVRRLSDRPARRRRGDHRRTRRVRPGAHPRLAPAARPLPPRARLHPRPPPSSWPAPPRPKSSPSPRSSRADCPAAAFSPYPSRHSWTPGAPAAYRRWCAGRAP
ncbi:hypothetical protein GCM10020256_24900 [Streptomyces thermocoprophilus]